MTRNMFSLITEMFFAKLHISTKNQRHERGTDEDSYNMSNFKKQKANKMRNAKHIADSLISTANEMPTNKN